MTEEKPDEAGNASASEARLVDVVVIGAGIIGLMTAWTIARAGRSVCLIDENPSSGSTYAAAGMLAPVSEYHYQEESLLELMLASSALYPALIAELALTGEDNTGYRSTTTISVGVDAGDRVSLTDLRIEQLARGLSVAPLSLREVRTLEPMLSPRLSSAFAIGQDHQVDPRRLSECLIEAIRVIAIEDGWGHEPFIAQNVVGLLHERKEDSSSRVTGVTLANGSEMVATEVIVANGLAAGELAGLPGFLRLALRPVFGDILRLRVPEQLRPLLSSTVRGLVRGIPIYLVPRDDGTVVLGATQRENGSSGVSAGAVHQLLRDAQELVPAVAELELIEITARARAGTPDNAPLLGRVSCAGVPSDRSGHIPGLIIATGFFRHGVLLAPIAAQICLGLLDGVADARWAQFRPDRFSNPATSASPEGATA